MTEETYSWLENNVRVGFTGEKYGRGNAWWYQGDEASQFEDAVPFDVAASLLDFPVEKRAVAQQLPDGTWQEIPGKASITRTTDNQSFQVAGADLQIHLYREWLLDKVGQATDANLEIGSVALLRGGAQAFVQFEFPEALQHPASGESMVPFIGATTSLDSSLASEFKLGTIRMVCDNTRHAFFSASEFLGVKRKHTKHSGNLTASDLRKGLGIAIETVTESYWAELDAMLATPVSGPQWEAFKGLYVPAKEGSKVSQTRADNKRADLDVLYATDPRVSPWAGTSWGVLQAVSTYDQHVRSGSKDETSAERYARNVNDFLRGSVSQAGKSEKSAMEALATVLA